MPWLLFLLAAGAMVVAFMTTSIALAIICLLAALGLALAGVMGLLSRRVGNQTRQEAMMIDPKELQRLREQADARRNVEAAGNGPSRT